MPGHKGVIGNEVADTYAKEAARGGTLDRRAEKQWSGLVYPFSNGEQLKRPVSAGESRANELSTYPRPYSKPMIRIALRNAPKAIASRFCKLLSGHALISPLLKER